MNKRTNIDFSRHQLQVKQLDGVLIHEFKRPDTRNCMLVFINACGVLTVTGDLGNWVFCREFHPSSDSDAAVSGGYWDEKLQISSVQKSHIYDSEETEKAIKDFEESFEDNYGRELNDEEIDWIEQLKASCDDEHEYVYVAYRQKPSHIDYENIPYGKKRHFWLNAVYDGFDAICEHLRQQSSNTDNP